MISTYRELLNYVDSIKELNDQNINDLSKATLDLSKNIQTRVDLQFELFIKSLIIGNTKDFQKQIKTFNDIESFQLELLNLKKKYKLLYNLAKINILSNSKSSELKEYIISCAKEYQDMLVTVINVNSNEQFNLMVKNTNLVDLEA